MTTRVTVEPADLRVIVTLDTGPLAGNVVTTDNLEPRSSPRDYWIHGYQVVTVREHDEACPE